MKTTGFAILIFLPAAMLAACQHNAGSDSKSGKDTLGKNGVVVGSMSSPDMDPKFVAQAATEGMSEVEMGKLAEKKASSSLVREFGGMMVRDYAKMNDKLKSIASQKGMSFPASPTKDQTETADKLRSKSGDDFDKAYVSEMTDDHRDAINYYHEAKESIKDTDLAAFINNALPILRMHYNTLTKIKEKTGK